MITYNIKKQKHDNKFTHERLLDARDRAKKYFDEQVESELFTSILVYAMPGQTRQVGDRKSSKYENYGFVICHMDGRSPSSNISELNNKKALGGEFFYFYSNNEEVAEELKRIKGSEGTFSAKDVRLAYAEKEGKLTEFEDHALRLINETEAKIELIEGRVEKAESKESKPEPKGIKAKKEALDKKKSDEK